MSEETTITDRQQFEDRHIEIRRDVINSAIISGDNNKVVIYHYPLDRQVQSEGKSSISELGTNPYRGLAAFEVEDADVYFGREKEVDRLWNRLWYLYEQSQYDKLLPRLLPILGPSGSGKSSLVRAGLLPELARRPLPGYKKTRVLILKPGETPLEKMALILARIATGDPSPAVKTQEFKEVLETRYEQETHDGLSFIASILPEQDYPLVVLVDQFEEIYSPDADVKQGAAFVETLLEAAVSRKAQVSVAITLRSDFLGETQQHPKLNLIIGSDRSVFLPVMTPDQLRLAIEKPAEKAGHPLDFATVDQLVEQTNGREGALPLLQVALTSIWEELSNSNFSKSSKDILREIGGVGGALAEKADSIYNRLDSEERDIARRLFIELVQIGEGTRYTRRSSVKVSNLLSKLDKREQVLEIIARFSSDKARLITLSSIDDEKAAEVSHEALFENWNLLREWLEKHRELLKKKQKIEAAEQEWKTQNKKTDYLMQGRRLREARDFQQEVAQRLPLSTSTEEFIKASIKHQRIKRLRSIGVFLIIPLIGTIIGGYFVIRELQSSFDMKLIRNCQGEEHCQGRIEALERLVKTNRNLKSYNLRGAHLERVDLRDAHLERVDLRDAHLEGAYLIGAWLSGADLRGAHLEGARLEDTSLGGADLRGAHLNRAMLSGAYLNRADLSGAHLSGAYLKNVVLDRANLSGADLSGAYLDTEFLMDAYLNHANFRDAKLSAYVERADFSGAYLVGADLSGAYLKDVNLNHANLERANLSGTVLKDVNLTPTQIKSACFWKKAIYNHMVNYKIDEKANQKYIEELKQDKASNPKEPVNCSKWK